MTITEFLARELSPDPATALLEIEGLWMGEQADPQMTKDEKDAVRHAELTARRDVARKQQNGSKM